MRARRAALLALSLLAMPAPAWASQGESSIWGLGWHLLNFAILVAVLVHFGRAPVQSFFAERRRTIETEIESARQQLDEAEEELSRWRNRLSDLDSEIDELRSSVRRQAEAEAARLLEQARAAAERIRRDAAAAVQQESRRAREVLRAEAGVLAVELAAEKLRSEVRAEDRARLADEFVRRIEPSSAAGDRGAER